MRMKKGLLFLVGCWLLVLGAKAQGHIAFPSANASWSDRSYYCFEGYYADIHNNRFWYSGDTTINTIVYHTLIGNGEYYYKNCGAQYPLIYNYYAPKVVAYLREDSSLH